MAIAVAAARRPSEREASMATWRTRSSRKWPGQISLLPMERIRVKDGPSKSPASLRLAPWPALPLPSSVEDDDADEAGEDINNNNNKQTGEAIKEKSKSKKKKGGGATKKQRQKV